MSISCDEVEDLIRRIKHLNPLKGTVSKAVFGKKDDVLYIKYVVMFEVVATDDETPSPVYIERLL